MKPGRKETPSSLTCHTHLHFQTCNLQWFNLLSTHLLLLPLFLPLLAPSASTLQETSTTNESLLVQDTMKPCGECATVEEAAHITVASSSHEEKKRAKGSPKLTASTTLYTLRQDEAEDDVVGQGLEAGVDGGEEEAVVEEAAAMPPLAQEEEDGWCGRERLKRHRVEVAGRVWIPETWGQEELLKDWIDCSAFDAALFSSNGIMYARDALAAQQGLKTTRLATPCPRGLRIGNRC